LNKTSLTGSQLARHVGKSPQAIDQATKAGKLFRDPKTQRYSCSLEVNSIYIENSLQENEALSDLKPDQVPEQLRDLYQEKLHWEVERTKAQTKKYQAELAIKQKDMIPVELMELWMGYFRQGIETNFLTIARRIARGDKGLELRIDKEITNAIIKTKEGAAKALRDEGPEVIRAAGGLDE
jgi:hypothetical protein